ncbi:CSLREA domain-containing protein [Patescibacteria group bacterium]|nr:CSLREA domain-containing protein [Patescibacteria group bacterium]
MKKKLIYTAIVFFAVTLINIPVAKAATFVVDTTSDTADANPGNGTCADASANCSLRAAIEEANALAGVDIITLPAGTYLLTISHLSITSDITINGADEQTTIVDSNNTNRVFEVSDNANSPYIYINDLTITRSSLYGIRSSYNFSGMTRTYLTNVIVEDCTTGGLFNTTETSMYLDHVKVVNNR